MKITTLIYAVLIFAVGVPWNVAVAQSAVSTAQPQGSSQLASLARQKRSANPDSIKRAKLTRLRKDVALTDEQATKVRPMIDAYVDETQTIKADPTLDSRTKRQKFAELRQKYDSDLDGVLNTEQQQKLASLKEQRRARLRAARSGTPPRRWNQPVPPPRPQSLSEQSVPLTEPGMKRQSFPARVRG